MQTIMLRCVAMSVVGRSVRKDIPVPLNAGNPVGAVNGQLPEWNYHVVTAKIASLGRLASIIRVSSF